MAIDKIIDPNVAANAYSNTLKIGKNGPVDNEDGIKFSQFLEGKAQQFVDTMKEGEKMSARAVTGEADLTEVVEAVTAAEITLQTVVAVRDRLLSAYQEIMRMPI
jgi:flagellar hook-basal body complex protein FliE